MPPKTTIEKLSSPSPDVTVFKITGTLGFHEKTVLERIFNECNRRGMSRVLFEVSELESLGGGCARILREEASRARVAIGLVGASRTVLKFLKNEDAPRIVVVDTMEAAVPAILAKLLASSSTGEHATETDDSLLSNESLNEILKLGDGPADQEDGDASDEEEAGEAGREERRAPASSARSARARSPSSPASPPAP